MYKHHEESLERLKEYFSDKTEVIAVIFGGSVAKGCERIDSDLDAMVVITDEAYEDRIKENKTAETIGGYCTYEGGYFDIKYMTKNFYRRRQKREASRQEMHSLNQGCFLQGIQKFQSL